MNKKQSKNYSIHFRTNKQIIDDLDKVAESLTKRNKKEFTRSDVIRRAIEQYIWNQKADRKI